jgi:hypothetical protein
MYKIWCWSFFMLSSTLVQIWIKYYISCFMYYLLSKTQKVEKITEFFSESIPKFISIIWENVGWIWGLPFMNLNKLDVKNKNINLYCIFYILFIRNQRKNWLPNKYRFRPFSSLTRGLGCCPAGDGDLTFGRMLVSRSTLVPSGLGILLKFDFDTEAVSTDHGDIWPWPSNSEHVCILSFGSFRCRTVMLCISKYHFFFVVVLP